MPRRGIKSLNFQIAKEIFDPKAIKNFGSMSKPDIKNAAAKLHL